jgi:hypothetical protein
MAKSLFLVYILTNLTTFALGQSKLNDSLVLQLALIATEDQTYRGQLETVQSKYGGASKEMQDLGKTIREKDSINLIKVKAIIDKFGWLGPDVIGDEGNSTLFLVVQHSDINTQEKYLPLMREAVKNGKAKASSLALLVDRVALRQGKNQIYGSQVVWDMKTNEYYVMPLEDPENVDVRRSQVGLPPLSVYLSNWQLKWDINKYKKDLPKVKILYSYSKTPK